MRHKKSIQKKLGLSIYAICIYLGVARSVYVQYRRGERSLNSRALLKLSQLEAAYTLWLAGEYEVTSIPPDPGAAEHLQALEHRKQECSKRWTEVNNQLQEMKKTYSLLQFQWNYFHQRLSIETDPRQTLELEILLEEVSKALKGGNITDQLILQHKADMLFTEIHLLNEKINR